MREGPEFGGVGMGLRMEWERERKIYSRTRRSMRN